MRIRLKHPEGTSTLTFSNDATVADLKSKISNEVNIGPFTLAHGYPPKELDLDQFDDSLKLSDTGTKFDGEQLIVSRRDIAKALQQPLNSPPPAPAPVATGGAPDQITGAPKPPLKAAPSPTTPARDPNTDEPPEVPVPTAQATCILRVMPDDNSCLFRAISSAMLGDLDSTAELRSVVASTIQSQPDIYTSVILEREPTEYCKWIQREDSWGGAIELGILSQHFDVEIASINVQDLRVDKFNEGKPTRCVLVYSGIHYDVIALSPSEPPFTHADLPPELDVKVFDAVDNAPLEAAVTLCRTLQQRHYYTDTAKFTIVCGDCGWKGSGEKEAQAHCKQTGHYNFAES